MTDEILLMLDQSQINEEICCNAGNFLNNTKIHLKIALTSEHFIFFILNKL